MIMKFFASLAILSTLALAGGSIAWAQKSAEPVRLGIAGISGTNSHPFVDKQLGLYQKNNIDVELIAFQGGTQLIQAMLAGDLPLSFSEGTAALASNIKGVNLVFIAGVVNTFPFTILAKAEIKTPSELRGKKIAVSRPERALRGAPGRRGGRGDREPAFQSGRPPARL
jgi:NitT/TauT family transport system substrate-binding protein